MKKYTDIPYVYTNHPSKIHSLEEAHEKGINCITLVHLFYQYEFSIILPKHLRAIELHDDHDQFCTVENNKKTFGDIVFMTREMFTETLKTYHPSFDENGELLGKCPFHLGIYIGKKENEELFLHASWPDQKVVISTTWELTKRWKYRKYESIFLSKRHTHFINNAIL